MIIQDQLLVKIPKRKNKLVITSFIFSLSNNNNKQRDMKRSIMIFMILLVINIFGNNKCMAQIMIRATYYNPVSGQGHGNPLITADGSKIDIKKLKNRRLRWVALSRDLFKMGFNMGDTIEIESSVPFYSGLWVIKDKMGKNMKKKIDFLVYSKPKQHPPKFVTIRRRGSS